jgi:hypothetical protein
MTLLERRLSKLEASISLEAQPGTGKVVMVLRDRGEDPDAAIDRHLAAHPQNRGAKFVIVHLRKMLGDDDEEGI